MQAVSRQGSVEPFYFGPVDSPLFGCYHPAATPVAKSTAAVLCPPIGREYSRSHRTFKQLANRLASAGYSVLRFDFFGCGDSSGELSDAHPQRWLEDIAEATRALEQRCVPASVSLVGLRLGATLALQAGAGLDRVHSLVAWEPFATGQAFLDDLETAHRAYMAEAPVPHPPINGGAGSTEMMGLRFSNSGIEALRQLDATNITAGRPAGEVLLVTGAEARESGDPIHKRLISQGVHVVSSNLPSPEVWRNDQHALVPGRTLQAVLTWMNEACP